MSELITSINLNLNDFAVDDEFVLRENLKLAEEKCCELYVDLDEVELKRKLWVHLVELSIKLENLQLAELLIAKLGLIQLALLVRSSPQPGNKINDLIALHYVASYFNVEQDLKHKIAAKLRDFNKLTTSLDHERLVELHVECGQWNSAFVLIDDDLNPQIRAIRKRNLSNRLALHAELEEEFERALINYEQAGGQLENGARLILKQFMNTAYRELRNYCSKNNTRLANFWNQYNLMAFGDQISLPNSTNLSVSSGVDCAITFYRCGRTKSGTRLFKETILSTIEEEIKTFVADSSANKWFKRRKIESAILAAASLSPSSRSKLAELSRRYDQSNLIFTASGIYVCINQVEAFLSSSLKFLDQLDCLELACQFKSPETILNNMMEYLSRGKKKTNANKKTKKKDGNLIRENEVLSKACIELGLIDEAFQIFSCDGFKDEQIIIYAMEYLETQIKTGSYNNVDPELREVSLSLIRDSLIGNQILATNVITTVILCITILLHKLDTNNNIMEESLNLFLPKLEVMFEKLSEFFEQATFNTSDIMIRSTNNLVTLVKDKLDFLSDSDIVKKGFRQLVETTAGRCMIEGQYKSAAMLYSHIEDNVNAVKSLMRTGDVTIVMNFSLLVRDITVNKITINYLRHLNVEPKVIEDFIARSSLKKDIKRTDRRGNESVEV